MHQYQVCHSSADRGEVVLTDHLGRLHRAQLIRDVPEVGLPLRGPHPALGLGVLMDEGNHRAFKLIFEQLDCDRPTERTLP
jgi:hypothetical protein